MSFLARVLVATLVAFPIGSSVAAPNVVFILADDLGCYDLGCYGRRDHRTPNLDKLALDGARFTTAYAAQSVCSPTRAAIMTGKSPARLHITTFLPGRGDAPSQKLLHPKIDLQLPLAEVTLAERLKSAGYATACVGKWHLGNKGFLPTDQGFDVYHPGKANTAPDANEGGKGEYDLTSAAIKFVEESRDKPFFLYLCHNNPHIPYTAQEARIKANAGAFEPVYAAVVETLDDAVGRLLAKLDELKLAENTIVIFTSDNGGLHVPEGPHDRVTHNGPYRAGKGFLYEGGIRVPLIVRWPGKVKPGSEPAEPVISTDWTPTLLDLVGQPVPSGLDGAGFAGIFRGEKLAARDLYWHMPHYMNQGSRPCGAIRSGDWKLIEHYEDGSAELYHLPSDAGERTDWADRRPQEVRAMRAKLAAWLTAVGAQRNSPNPAFDAAKHKTLYVDIDASRYVPTMASNVERERMRAWRMNMNAAMTK
ncbi:MAG: sulfatase [Gemmataceae bacterium]